MVLDTVLLLALPASGKSEVRRYLAHLDDEVARRDFHLGPTVQLDDFPYVHLMRRVDDVLVERGRDRVYFEAPERSFIDPTDWGTLIELLNQDYEDLIHRRRSSSASAAEHMLARFDAASAAVGAASRMIGLSPADREAVSIAIEDECRAQLDALAGAQPDSLEGRTIVIEFARGGPEGSSMPLEAPHGYRYSISRLSPALLEKARVLYIWVTPEESRKKNLARADPNDPGSILHHGVPEHVMRNAYGCDDMDWLEASSSRPGCIEVERGGRTYALPVARFDNRVDRTSFIRDAPSSWRKEDVEPLDSGLRRALGTLAAADR